MPGRRALPRTIAAVVAVGLALVGPAATVRAHAQLVASDPAAGDVIDTAPTEIRLVFSEPISQRGTSLDLLGPDGATLAEFAGAPDPADPYALVADVAPLEDGLYTVDYRSLSAADGHSTSGSFTFGVGDVAPPPIDTGGAGAVHGGHDAATSLLETESRIAGDVGLLLAFGLPLVGWLVLGRVPVGLARTAGIGLLFGALGAGGLLILSASGAGIAVVDYADVGNGRLLVVRLTLTLVAGLSVLALARRRPTVASAIASLAGLAGLVLVVAAGHAAAYAEPAPVIALVVHVMAVGIWLSGLVALVWVATLGDGPGAAFRLVPRFSALALVSVTFMALTGLYAEWIHTRSLLPLDTPYGLTLTIKSVLALTAIALGAISYLGIDRAGFRLRIAVEAAVLVGVLAVTGVLTSGSPPGQEEPIAIAPATTSALSAQPASLALAPGRPGPTRFLATLEAPLGPGDTLELALTRLDQPSDSRIPMRPVPGSVAEYAAPGGLLPPDSRWDAALIHRDAAGIDRGRSRFTFALDATTVTQGRATPAIDPVVVIAAVLLIGATVAGAFALAGGSPPRVDRRLGRQATVIGAGIAAALGAVLLLAGPAL